MRGGRGTRNAVKASLNIAFNRVDVLVDVFHRKALFEVRQKHRLLVEERVAVTTLASAITARVRQPVLFDDVSARILLAACTAHVAATVGVAVGVPAPVIAAGKALIADGAREAAMRRNEMVLVRRKAVPTDITAAVPAGVNLSACVRLFFW